MKLRMRVLAVAALAAALLSPAWARTPAQDSAEALRRRVANVLAEELARLRASLVETVRRELSREAGSGSVDAALRLVTEGLLKRHATFLASDELEGRQAGFDGGDKAGVYIADVMKTCGLAPVGDKDAKGNPTYFQVFKIRDRVTRNCLGVLEGSDPDLKKEFVVLGAHYDHLGTADQPGPPGQRMDRARDNDRIWNGADDNGSGTTVLLALAKAFGEGGLKPKRSILFIAFSGEEEGLLGSFHYVEHPIAPLGRHIFMLNLDMVGRNPEKPVKIDGVGSAEGPRLRKVCEDAAAAAGLNAVVNDRVTIFGGDSDHTPFRDKGVPFIFFFSGFHADYHKVTDHADRLAYANMVRVAGTAGRILMAVADSGDSLTYKKLEFGPMVPARPRRMLGIFPKELEESERAPFGLKVGEGGLRVEKVNEGSAGQAAGLKAGDVIVRLGGKPLEAGSELETIRSILEGVKPGQEVEIVIYRDGEKSTVKAKWDK
ncbi:MAG TPA: M20/M25/M40 family metallo-hydrolase [Planctomycetota bacterium]|nr:M20/M25/M40 family metallo-hydrolase [Planctomycetota bacterium]